jgi:hypothetical protein
VYNGAVARLYNLLFTVQVLFTALDSPYFRTAEQTKWKENRREHFRNRIETFQILPGFEVPPGHDFRDF